MGVTIHYQLGQIKEHVPKMLDRAQKFAEAIRDEQACKTGTRFHVQRHHPYRLSIAIGECETLNFGFASMSHWREMLEAGRSYEASTLPEQFPEAALNSERMMWCSAYCKTQYANSLVEHKWVADILLEVASYCTHVNIYDEGGYYHSGDIQDSAHAISENGKFIASLGNQLKENFGADNVIAGGETHIRPIGGWCSVSWCRNEALHGENRCAEHKDQGV